MQKFDVIIIGAGPAGLAAAIYTSRADLSTLVIDEASAGGQVKTTHQVANYPGFIEPIAGHDLAGNMRKQAEKYNTKFKLAADITTLHLSDQEKLVELDDENKYTAEFVIIATGSSPRLLNIPGEQEYKGSGVSYCATCDGEFYKGKDIFVIGGGNSAMEESLLLLQFAKSITIIHQFDNLQAEKITADKVTINPKVNIMWSHEPRAFYKQGDKMIIEAEDLKTKKRIRLKRDGIFIFVGLVPNNTFLNNIPIQLTENGYIKTTPQMETNIKGVYAVGDVRDKKHRQITTAVNDGTIAALEVIQKI
ncbi:MAG: FAD-dependent oxidoreductase [Candidatus Marinimicrobia bacterium]|nr:FAD-dependent oxidoreductase [Candidatus Neomarinimicrobiota bacterium]